MGYRLAPLLERQEVGLAVRRMASEMARDLKNDNPLLIGVLKGTFILMADLVRHLDFPLEVDFVTLSSYGPLTHSCGDVKTVMDISRPVAGRNVIIVEDIVDSGRTLDRLLSDLWRKKPRTIRVCVLLDKKSRREIAVPVDYRGFEIPDKFVVGYGIDWDEKFRNLPGIYSLEME